MSNFAITTPLQAPTATLMSSHEMVDGWTELDTQTAPAILVPQSYIQALEALIAAEKQKIMMAIKLHTSQQQIEVLEPKAAALDLIGSTNDTYTLTEASKLLKVRLMDLTAWLKSKGWIYGHRAANFKPTAAREYQKHLILRITNYNEHNSTQVRITSKGLVLIAKTMAGVNLYHQ